MATGHTKKYDAVYSAATTMAYVPGPAYDDDAAAVAWLGLGQAGVFNLVGYLEAAQLLVLLGACAWLRRAQRADAQAIARPSVAPDDYTLWVHALPPRATRAGALGGEGGEGGAAEAALAMHFELSLIHI